MDESALGNRDKRGFWRPNKKLNYGPVLVWPFKVWVFLKWLFGYPGFIFPWNAGYVAITVIASVDYAGSADFADSASSADSQKRGIAKTKKKEKC